MATKQYKHLNQEQIDNFMKYGWLKIPQAFSKEKAAAWTEDIFLRLGYDINDKSTWKEERINMPSHKQVPLETFAPKALATMCELLGGEERVNSGAATWNDGLIVNLGTDEWEGKWPHPSDLTNWHVDGDFFMHFLDSPEQGLLVIPLFTNIKEHGGGTMICPDAIGHVARYLYDHPDGVTPRMSPRSEPTKYPGLEFYFDIAHKCSTFHEMTGEIGDVILMHPLMMHSASRNSLRIPRMITNPPVSLNAPFNFDRENPDDYSLVEKKTLQELGRGDRLQGWKITGTRDPVVPERLKRQAQMKIEEEKRLKKLEEMRAQQQQPLAKETAVA